MVTPSLSSFLSADCSTTSGSTIISLSKPPWPSFGKTVNFQCFATLEPGVRFHFPKWQTKWQTIPAILCNTMQYHEMPSIPNPRNTIDYHWITLNTKGGGQHWPAGPALLFIWTYPNSLGFAIDNPKLVEDLYAVWMKEPDDPEWTHTQYTEK